MGGGLVVGGSITRGFAFSLGGFYECFPKRVILSFKVGLAKVVPRGFRSPRIKECTCNTVLFFFYGCLKKKRKIILVR